VLLGTTIPRFFVAANFALSSNPADGDLLAPNAKNAKFRVMFPLRALHHLREIFRFLGFAALCPLRFTL
jgi:hypothetical protein